jgi:exodeoxyribonuclease VII small subunit
MTPSYESAFIRLEEILEKMNTGKLTLEEGLKLYEEAEALIGQCSKNLKEADEKIEALLMQREGAAKIEPLKL